jgi:hypothetical protein
MHAWFRELGVSHRHRDDVASRGARTLELRDREHAVLRRWPNVVAALRTLSHCYNEGAGYDVLAMVDGAGDDGRDLFVQIVARGGQALTMTLVGAELCVRTTPGTVGATDDGTRWLTFEASDEAIAAYALQHWLTQL